MSRIRETSLTHKTASGVAWLVAQTVLGKAVALAGTLLLAHLLDPGSFGLWAQTMTVALFATLIQGAGLHEVLIQRHRRFQRWATAAFWMSIGFGLLASLFMIAAAGPVAQAYRAPQVVNLVLIAAAAPPLQALATVPGALLSSQLRFKLLATIALIHTLVQWTVTVALAAAGCGAYSFIVPLPAAALVRTALVWALARPRIRPALELRRWRFLIGPSTTLMSASAVSLSIDQGDRILLSLMHGAAVVGVYHFAFNLSMQTRILFGAPLVNVLLPSLSKLRDDPPRQAAAFLRAARALTVLIMPVSFLLAAMAAPLFSAVLPEKWAPAVPAFRALSVGMGLAIVWYMTRTLLLAQGRYRTALLLLLVSAGLFLASVALAAALGGAIEVSICVAVFYAVMGPVSVYVAIRPAGAGFAEIRRMYAAPTAAAALALVLAVGAAALLPSLPGRDWLSLAAIAAVGSLAYLLLIRRLAPQTCAELLQTLRQIAPRLPLPAMAE